MKNIRNIFISLIVLFAVNISYSQPKLILHITGGYAQPLGTFAGTWPNHHLPASGMDNYFMKPGFSMGAGAKYFINSKRSVAITGSLSYSMFNNGDLKGYSDEFGNPITFKNKINVFSVAAGAEYDFLSKGKINPFAGAEFSFNFFNGSMDYTDINLPGNNAGPLKSATRVGLGFGGGVDWYLNNSVGTVVGVKYVFANMLGKDNTSGAGGYLLNDGSYNDYYGSHHSRNIQYAQFYAGVSFYFMQPKK